MPVVTFLPSARAFNVLAGGSLLRAARRARLPIASSCHGQGVCKACRVRVLAGAQSLSAPSAVELDALAHGELDADERFACLAHVLGPVTITTSYW